MYMAGFIGEAMFDSFRKTLTWGRPGRSACGIFASAANGMSISPMHS